MRTSASLNQHPKFETPESVHGQVGRGRGHSARMNCSRIGAFQGQTCMAHTWFNCTYLRARYQWHPS